MWRSSALLVCLATACTGIIESPGETPAEPDAGSLPDVPCSPAASDRAPATPVVLTPSPVSGKTPVHETASLSITSSPFSDPDGDALGAADVEIWSVVAGVPETKVWGARVTDPAKLASGVTLADGEFVVTELFPWTEYVVRVRYHAAGCALSSPYSEPVLFRTDDNSGYLYDETQVREVYLYIPQTSWDPINAEAILPGCVPYKRTYYPADLVYEGIRYNGVGLHVKGGCGSDRALDKKSSFKVAIDWDDPAIEGCPEGRRLLGQHHLTLNNMIQDCSNEHEKLAYRLYAAMGVPVPRSAYVRLYVNDEYWGVYLNLEPFDRRMMARNFGSGNGMLYEGTYGCDLSKSEIDGDITAMRCDPEFNQDECDGPADPDQDPTGDVLLRQLVDQIDAIPVGQFMAQIGNYVDLQEVMSLWAVDVVIDHWDNSIRGGNNHRIYHDVVSDRWKLLSSGVDQTYTGPRWKFTREINHILGVRCFQERACIAAWENRVNEVIAALPTLGLPAYADALHERIRPYAEVDPRRECDNATWEQRHVDLKNWINSRPARLPVYMLGDDFRADLDTRWSTLGAPAATVGIDTGMLEVRQTANGRWNGTGQGKFVYKTVTGNIMVHGRVRAERDAGGDSDRNQTYTGVMMRNPNGAGSEDYVFIGVGRENSTTMRILRNITANNASTEVGEDWDYPGSDFDARAEVRVCRVGTKIRVYKFEWNTAPDPDRFEWVLEQEYDQPADFGDTIQVGFFSSAADTAAALRARMEWVDFAPVTDLNQCDD